MSLLWRIAASLGCALFSCATLSWFLATPNTFLDILKVTAFSALPGWLLALPIVYRFRDAEANQDRTILFYGAALGPLVVLGWSLYLTQSFGPHRFGFGSGLLLLSALVVSSATTGAYVLLLKLFSNMHEQS